MTYKVTLVDKEGYHLTAHPELTNLKEAKRIARYLLSDNFAFACGSTHEQMQTSKVEVKNQLGECLYQRSL